jgi:hypothetical protein
MQDVRRLRLDLAADGVLVHVVDPALALGGGQLDDLAAVHLAAGVRHVGQVLADDRRVDRVRQHDAGVDVADIDIQLALHEGGILLAQLLVQRVLAMGLEERGAPFGHCDRVLLGGFVGGEGGGHRQGGQRAGQQSFHDDPFVGGER